MVDFLVAGGRSLPHVMMMLVPEAWATQKDMPLGILGALAQTDIKRILSFILVSHIGYMIFGLGLATEAGLAATVYYVAHHITVQTTLFLVTGLIENRAGTANIDRLSLTGNYEVNVEIFDRGVAQHLERVFATDLSNATQLTAAEWERRGTPAKLTERLLAPLRPLL